jgi:dTDP-4-dehydrorhamnose 3,5-epimerase
MKGVRLKSKKVFEKEHWMPEMVALTKGAIEGVSVKDVKSFPDERGFFQEVGRIDNPFFDEGFGGELFSLLRKGVDSGWVFHPSGISWFYTVYGQVKVSLYDNRPDSPTFGHWEEVVLDNKNPQLLKVVAGVAYKFEAISSEVRMLQFISKGYDRRKISPISEEALGLL